MSVIREYERVIYKVCYLYTTPNATLSDLYQEVVLNIWKAFPKFRKECKVSTWIYRIALNTCISFIRKEKNIPEIVTLTQEADRSEEDDETQAMLRQLYRMINRLGQLEKSIILLYLEEKSYEEELDELKKSWNALDAQLQKEPIADEKQIKELLASYKTNTRRSLRRLVVLQRFSLGVGAVGLAVILLIWLLQPTFGFNEHLQNKTAIFLAFITVTILGGMWWDRKTYLWNRNTRVDEMSVAEVSRRMATFRYWTRYEVWAVAVWAVIFTALFYWVMDYYTMPLIAQAAMLGFCVIWDVILIYFIYKKVVYKHLDSIKKNIEELEDICTE